MYLKVLSQFFHKRALCEGKGNLIFLTQASDWEPGNGENPTLAQAVKSWRRGRDLNPRHPMGEPDFESGAFSRARPPLRFCLVSLVLPQTIKKRLKNCRRIVSEYSAGYRQPVIQSGVIAELIKRLHCAGFGIKAAKNKASHACLNDGSHAHDTRFKRHIKLTVAQSPTTEMAGRLLDRQ